MNPKLLAWTTVAVVLIVALWPRIVVPVDAFPVALPTAGLILTGLAGISAGLLWSARRACRGFRSSPYPRIAA
jgi:uncharacterized membrane protein YhhN